MMFHRYLLSTVLLLLISASPALAGSLKCAIRYTLETPEARAKSAQGDLTMPEYHSLELVANEPLRVGLLNSASCDDKLLSAGASILAKTPDKLSFRITLKKLKSTGFPLVMSGSTPVPTPAAPVEINLFPNSRDLSDNGILAVTLTCNSN